LLIRLYDVPENTIFINGTDINSCDIVQLREKICYITQDNFLFSSSISNNVTLFKEGFEDKEVENSLKLSAFSDDLSKLEDGIETIIGEKGIDLSGGQKQRVAIARAILKNSDVVIFDDCFSALDNKTEEVVFNNIKELFKDKICIVISNRISEVRDADEIIVLNQGKIEERGKHKQLVENIGLYNKFYYQQLSQERIDD
jgi:ATP-binding cassette subfamily B protein